MHLVERDKEFQVLTSQLSDCLQGKGGVILITGPVACGKTALLHAFAEHAKACRVIYVDAVATRREKDFPLGLVGQILRNPRLSLEDSSNGNPSLASRILGSMSHDNGPESPEAVPGEGLEQLWKPVRDLAKWIPVVIGIDDLQHADEASMHALLYLIRRITSVPIMVVLNLSSFPQAEFSYFEAELRSQRHCRRIPLRSLSLSGVATVVAESVDRHASRQLIQSFHNMSGGNPLLLHTLIEDTRPDSRQATAGQAFAQAVLLCLH